MRRFIIKCHLWIDYDTNYLNISYFVCDITPSTFYITHSFRVTFLQAVHHTENKWGRWKHPDRLIGQWEGQEAFILFSMTCISINMMNNISGQGQGYHYYKQRTLQDHESPYSWSSPISFFYFNYFISLYFIIWVTRQAFKCLYLIFSKEQLAISRVRE